MDVSKILALLGVLLLILVHILPWIYSRSTTIILSPAKLSSVISAAHCLPHAVIVYFQPDRSEIYGLVGDGIYDLLFSFSWLYALGFVAFYLGIVTLKSRKLALHSTGNQRNYTAERNYTFPIIVCLLAYFLSLALIFDKAGGLANYIANFANRSDLVLGTGVYYIVKVPAAYLVIILLSIQYARRGTPNAMVLIFVIGVLVVSESLIGSRRTPMQYIIFSLITISMVKSDFRLLTFRNVIGSIIVIMIFSGILYIRYAFNPDSGEIDPLKAFLNFSYNDIYLFVVHHFSNNEFWYGKPFGDFLYRFIPLTDGQQAPSLDEGLYVYNLFIGRNVFPPLPLSMMYHNSWPPNTFGNGYMNFGLPGVIIFFYLKGLLTIFAFKIAQKNNFQAISLFFYLFISFAFQISNQRIAEILIATTGIFALYGFIWINDRLQDQKT